ncbi:MAG: dUTP diphosphatase [Candidatus Paceibacterota bacterium]|jgi:dUTP pyrophosphatase
MKLLVKKCRDDAKLPTRAHHDDAGIDLYSCGNHTIEPHKTLMIPIGISMEIEEGYVGLIWDKSSIGSKSIKTLGGVIDAGYRGELHVMVNNMSDIAYTFEHGHKVAQMLIQKVEFPEIEEISELSETKRGTGGFGSTGK